MKKYIFPLNYNYLGKLFGIIEYKLLLILSLFGVFLIFILSLLKFSLFAKISCFIVIFLPTFLILNTSVNHEPFYIFIISVIKHYCHSNKYIIK